MGLSARTVKNGKKVLKNGFHLSKLNSWLNKAAEASPGGLPILLNPI